MTEPSVQTISEGEATGQPSLDYAFYLSVDASVDLAFEQQRVITSDEGRDAARDFAKKLFLEDVLKTFDKHCAKVRAMLAEKLEVR